MALVERRTGSERAAALTARLREAAAKLTSILERIDEDRWRRVPEPGAWSISKDAEHIIEGAAYHQWIVRRTIGDSVPKRKPVRADIEAKLRALDDGVHGASGNIGR